MGRLQRAALELYRDHGYEKTTVAEIAERAGLTERTFFRYFADKREVLFAGSPILQALLLEELAKTDPSASPLDQIVMAVEHADDIFAPRDLARVRHQVITAHAELQERELIKLSHLASAFAEALRQRGIDEPAASLAAETGVAVFKVAFERWIAKGEKRSYGALVRDSLAELKAATR